LGGCGDQSLWLGDIVVSADLSWLDLGGLFANSSDLLIAVVIVNNHLDWQGHGCGLAGEGWDTNLGIDTGVGISAVDLWTIAIARAGG